MIVRNTPVGIDLESLTELLVILEEGVIGIDRIHAFGREAGDREYGRALMAFVKDWEFGAKLARARRILLDAAEAGGNRAAMAKLEEALLAVPDWTEEEESAARDAGPIRPAPPESPHDRATP